MAVSDASTKLQQLVDKYTAWRLESSPEYATGVDIHDYNNRLEDQSEHAYTDRYNKCCSEFYMMNCVCNERLYSNFIDM